MRNFMMGAAALALAGCVSVQHTEVADVMTAAEARAIVEARNDTFETLFSAHDAAGLAAQLYTKGGRLIPPDAPDMVGTEAIAGYWAGAVAAIDRVELITMEAAPMSDSYIIERTHVKLFGADGAMLGGGKAVVMWTLDDGAWKMHWDAFNNGPV